MAFAFTSATLPRSSNRTGTGLLASLRDALHRRRIYGTTVRELNALTNMELADLGLSRSMIRRVALEAAYGKTAA